MTYLSIFNFIRLLPQREVLQGQIPDFGQALYMTLSLDVARLDVEPPVVLFGENVAPGRGEPDRNLGCTLGELVEDMKESSNEEMESCRVLLMGRGREVRGRPFDLHRSSCCRERL